MIQFFKRRFFATFRHSMHGIGAAFREEEAFRVEVILLPFVIAAAIWLAQTRMELALLLSATILVLIVELLNTGIETVVDRISAELHPLSKIAKDVGSAAVLLSLIHFIAIWCLVCWR